ncbi:c-type cytochrome [Sansalvadorimonas sp. 2012CJ34-2]|uniref:C-type cytochrome n=1 Tax=Parendozoicomonas callyspongiae TaxID=2942213 RepID=A0ABT0PAU5_9GAMM|nr:c-type cytochrome [Sansalvadorimonas sp. 2012CJ34-2]MCL6268469.1 c-type cytochrome [Sansalvadorimonas sp. 2012CJ34-2]
MSQSTKLSVLFAASFFTLSTAWAAPVAQKPEAVYDKSCKICHDAGIAGAPKKHAVAEWESRLKLGMDALVETVKKGKGAMPPKGMCMDCTDEDYKAVITFMSSPKQP